ncbi:FHA domain-containing protein [bacterium]|nr:FHA domain-containing protein [bacterium]
MSLESPQKAAVSNPLVQPAEVDDVVPSIDPVKRKRRRVSNANKTRLIGFDTSDGGTNALFDEDKATDASIKFQFPVGIVMVTKGPGFGESFVVKSGMSQIGRGDDQAIRLDFGDMAISRQNHAAVVYDPKAHTFLIGHGGKSNIVRLNGKPVVSTSKLKNGDEIEIGETTLRFAALCSPKFNWDVSAAEEGSDDDDLEIA